jgi:hypothetical protein
VKRFRRRGLLAALIAALAVSTVSVFTPGLPFPRQGLSEVDLALLRLRSEGTNVESGGARLEVIEQAGPLEHEVPAEATIEVRRRLKRTLRRSSPRHRKLRLQHRKPRPRRRNPRLRPPRRPS